MRELMQREQRAKAYSDRVRSIRRNKALKTLLAIEIALFALALVLSTKLYAG